MLKVPWITCVIVEIIYINFDCGLELWNSKLRYSNYFSSVYMAGFLKFGHIIKAM